MILERRRFLTFGAAALATPALLGPQAVQAQTAATVSGSPSFTRRRVGTFEVTVLLDGTIDIDPGLIIGYDAAKAEAALERQYLAPTTTGMPIPVLGYIVNTGDRLIAVDCGTIPEFSPRTGSYHQALVQAGISAQDIDVVLATHLHPDHIGGLSDGANRLFPNAQVYVSEQEWNFWHNDDITSGLPEGMQPFVQIARGFTAPYDGRVKTFSGEAELFPGVQAVPLPGHTPGHTGYRFHSNGQDLLIWGDVIHMTKLQFDNPDWVVVFDLDAELTRNTRTRMLDMASTDRLMVAGSHIDFPGFGHVETHNGKYRFATAVHDYMI